MNTRYYNSKVGWWIYAVFIFSVGCCMIGPVIDGDSLWLGIALAVVIGLFELVGFMGVKYAVRGDEFGVRNFFRWTWFPVGKIASVRKSRGILSAAALSLDRVSIRFTDRSILKSSMPLEISPADRDGFIAMLLEINPGIKTD